MLPTVPFLRVLVALASLGLAGALDRDARAQGCVGTFYRVPAVSPGSSDNRLLAVAGRDGAATPAMAVGVTDMLTPMFQVFDGSSWSRISAPPGNVDRWNGVAIDSNGDYWCAGSIPAVAQSRRPMVARWSNGQWIQVVQISLGAMPVYPFAPRGGSVQAIEVIAPNDVWVGGSGNGVAGSVEGPVLVHFDGVSWTPATVPEPANRTHHIESLGSSGSSDVWAVGNRRDITSGFKATIWHWDGAAWTVVPNPVEGLAVDSRLRDIAVFSGQDAWAVGDIDGGALLLHWDGATWTRYPSPASVTTRLHRLAGLAPNDVWAVALGTQDYYHWNGQAWSLVGKPDVPGASDPTRSLDLAVTGGCGFWAVGVESAGGAPRAYAERYLPCAGTWTVYGVGVGGVAPPPVLRGVGCPVLNTVIAVEVTGAPSGLGLCALGFQRAAVPFLGGQLLVGGGVVDSLMCPIDAGGRGRLELGLPAVPALAGLDAQVQGFFLDASASGGVAMSAGLEISVR